MQLEEAFKLLNTNEEQVYCEIDPLTRQISVPEKYQILGVESDEEAERVWFKCPKIVGDNIDLTQLNICVNFESANKEKDRYWCDDVSVQGEYIIFSWLLSRRVTIEKGEVNFIVCAKKTKDDEVTNEWNTTIATSNVLVGLEADTELPQQEHDIVMQLIDAVNKLIAQGGAGGPRELYINEEGHLIAVYDI